MKNEDVLGVKYRVAFINATESVYVYETSVQLMHFK